MDKDRLAQAHNPIGPTLMFKEFVGREEMSRPFEWKLVLLTEQDATIKPTAVLGKDITIELVTHESGRRWFNGHVTRFAFIGKEPHAGTDLWLYEARLHCWLWYLTREADFRIFQNKTVPEILDEVFGRYPFPVEKKLTGHYRSWVYCVQYRETDFNFVSRLMELEGIYYYFKHEMGRHTLVLVDDLGAHQPYPGYATISYVGADRVVNTREDYVATWQIAQQVQTGKYFTDEYDFEKPSANLKRPRNQPFEYPHGDHLIYEWPGGYTEVADGENYAKLRLEELRAPNETVLGEGIARGVAPGYTFTLKNCPRRDQNREYLIVGASYFVRDNPYRTGDKDPATWKFLLTAQPTSFPYRPPRITPKPLTNGPQTAVVTGPPGEEIWTDKYGRVKVQFHWDQYGKGDDKTSCWIRVSHPWAGSNWGGLYIPRVGQEVIVDFIGGDPDYPIITGRVYNAEHMPPYELPKYKEYSTLKSHSTKKGAPSDWNELRFYDYKGKEQVFIHANWRMDVRVKWNKYETVKEQSHDLVYKNYYLTSGGNCDHYVKEHLYQRAEKGASITYGDKLQMVVENDTALSCDTSIEVNAAQKIVVVSGLSLTLKSSGGFITIDPSGITIQGTMVRINSGGSAASCTPFEAEHPYEATECDTGEPGYLDKPRKPGGWGKRKSSKGGGYGPMPPLPVPKPPPIPAPPAVGPAIPGSMGPYKSQDDAARAALDSANPTSIKNNREYGGKIYKEPKSGSYYATNPQPGTGDSFDPSKVSTPAGTNLVGDYHTHGDYSKKGADGKPVRAAKADDQYNSDNFSSTDKKGIASDAKGNPGYAGYLGTPSGTYRKYDPASKSDNTF